jgi:hypothetical protein
MKRITFLFLVTVSLLSACGPKETWNYLVLGGATQEYATKFPKAYKAFIEKDQRVSVEMDYYTGYSPGWILEQMDASQNLRDLIVNADIITFDWDAGSTSAADYSFLQGACGGVDNQDCLRAAYQEARFKWVAMLDKLIALRNGDTSGMIQIILGSWTFPEHYPDVSQEQMAVMLGYFQDMSVFLMEEAEKRGIEYVKIFDGEYLHEKPPPDGWTNGLALTEAGDKVVLEVLKKIEFEK